MIITVTEGWHSLSRLQLQQFPRIDVNSNCTVVYLFDSGTCRQCNASASRLWICQNPLFFLKEAEDITLEEINEFDEQCLLLQCWFSHTLRTGSNANKSDYSTSSLYAVIP